MRGGEHHVTRSSSLVRGRAMAMTFGKQRGDAMKVEQAMVCGAVIGAQAGMIHDEDHGQVCKQTS